MKEACRSVDYRMCEIQGFQYYKDDLGSWHRTISETDYLKTLAYYRKHIFIDGEFEAIEDYNFGPDNLRETFINDRKRMEAVYRILDIWGVTFTDESRVLDIGCGYGSFLNIYQERSGGKAYGIDICEVSDELARILNPHIEVYHFDSISVEELVIAKDIDTIIALDIIEHLIDVGAFLKRLYAVSPPGMKMIVEVPVIHPEFEYDDLVDFQYLYPTRHLHLYTPAGVIKQFKKSGFILENSTFFKNEFKCLMYYAKH